MQTIYEEKMSGRNTKDIEDTEDMKKTDDV